MTVDLLTALIEVNLAASFAILLVLMIRCPVRHRFGAGMAYGLWLLPPVAAVASLLPRPTFADALPQVPVREGLDAAIDWATLPGPTGPVKTVWEASELAGIGLAVWVAGAAVALGLAAIGHARGVARFGVLTPGLEDTRQVRAAHAGLGPALVGLLRPKLVLPSDFETRFSAREQALVLAHEARHIEAGDTRINTLIVLFSCLNWFNPLVHIAAYFARVDQELACDAAVVERFPGERRTYAEAMLKTQLATAPLPLGCYWPGGSSNLLNERLKMLASKTPTRARRIAGACALTLLCAGGGVVAWAASAPDAPARTTAVQVFAAPSPETPAQEAASPAVTDLPATINLSNAGTGEVVSFASAERPTTWGARRGTPDQIRAAIAARDPRGVYEMGGAAEEVVRALGVGADNPGRYVVVDGFLGFQEIGRNGELGDIGFPAHLATLAPPAGTPTVTLPNLDSAALTAFVSAGSTEGVMIADRSGNLRIQRLPPAR